MLYKKYFSTNKLNQEIFNKKLNWYFDIKSILYQKKNNFLKESLSQAKILKKDYVNLKINKPKIEDYSRQVIYTKKINWKKFTNSKDKKFKNSLKNIFKFLYRNNIKNFAKFFLVHGSISSNDYIKGWSDLDTFVVLRDEVLSNEKKIIEFRKILKVFYKKLIEICKFQHHGLIIYTEKDILSYLNGFLPVEALEKNFDILKDSKIQVNTLKRNKNLSLISLKERLKYLKDAKKTGSYKHHSYKGKNLEIPIKAGKSQMYQLFCHIGYILNIPILYFDATNRSIHKKKSFEKFYKEVKDNQIKNLIRKSEQVRHNWQINKFQNNNSISKWVVELIGKDYISESYLAVKKIIKTINEFNKKTSKIK